ncbi:MAG: GNAT family N-acetyltransferase [Bacteroidia bacterium]|nr:GNAT family N-acetyltransferase [Bacteroidia bacterium]
MRIRNATVSDIASIVRFQQSMARETEGLELDTETLQAGVAALLSDRAKGYYKVVEVDGVVIACHMVTFEWSDWRNGNVLWIQSVYVDPEYRKQGIFRKMYEHLKEEVLNDPAIKGIRLYVERNNRRAQQTYNALGMNGEHYQVYEWMK